MYLWSKSKIVRNVVEFWTFCDAPPNNLYISYHAHHIALYVAKFCRIILFTRDVIGADTLLIFDTLGKNSWRTPVLGGVCASKTWSFSSACKSFISQHALEVDIRSFEKVNSGGYDLTFKSVLFGDQSLPDVFLRKREESGYGKSVTCPILNTFIHFGDIRRRILIFFEIAQNCACLWPYFYTCPPEFWTCVIK